MNAPSRISRIKNGCGLCPTRHLCAARDLPETALDALGACLRPGHTRYDGDAVFAVSCGSREADPDLAGEAAFVAVGRAIETAIRAAQPLAGIPAGAE